MSQTPNYHKIKNRSPKRKLNKHRRTPHARPRKINTYTDTDEDSEMSRVDTPLSTRYTTDASVADPYSIPDTPYMSSRPPTLGSGKNGDEDSSEPQYVDSEDDIVHTDQSSSMSRNMKPDDTNQNESNQKNTEKAKTSFSAQSQF